MLRKVQCSRYDYCPKTGYAKLEAKWRRWRVVQIHAIRPEQFDSQCHRLPIAGELLLPGIQVYIQADGFAFALKQALIKDRAYGTVVELCRRGEGVEVAINAQRQDDGGYYFETLWVLVG